jgi:hypothetical protein
MENTRNNNNGPVNASVANVVINGHTSNARPLLLKASSNNHNQMNMPNVNSPPQNMNRNVSSRQRKRQTQRKNRKRQTQRKNRKTERKSR